MYIDNTHTHNIYIYIYILEKQLFVPVCMYSSSPFKQYINTSPSHKMDIYKHSYIHECMHAHIHACIMYIHICNYAWAHVYYAPKFAY